MITPEQRHELLLADRTLDVDQVRTAIENVMGENPDATLLDCEMALRDAAAHSYLVMSLDGVTLHIVLGMQAWRAALANVNTEARANHGLLLRSSRMAKGQAPGAT
jgi:hypothetical protein